MPILPTSGGRLNGPALFFLCLLAVILGAVGGFTLLRAACYLPLMLTP